MCSIFRFCLAKAQTGIIALSLLNTNHNEQGVAHLASKIASLLQNRGYTMLMAIVLVMHLATFMVTPTFPIFLERAGGFSLAEVGLLLGVGSVTYPIGSLIGGLLADRLGNRTVMMVGALMEGLAMGGYAISHFYGAFLLFAVVNGVGSGFLAPTIKAMIADVVPESERTAAFSWRGIAAHLGIMIAGVTMALLALGVSRSVFLYAAVSFAGLALVIRLFLPNDRCEGPGCKPLPLSTYTALWRNRPFVLFSAVSFLLWALYAQFTLLMPLKGEHVLGSAAHIGLIFTINSFSVVLLQGVLSRFLIERINPYISLAAGTLLIGSGLFAMGFAINFLTLSLAALTFILGEMMLMPVIDSLIGRFAQEELLGAYFGISNFVSGIGTAIGTSLGGYFVQKLGGVDATAPWIGYGLAGLVAAGLIGLFSYYLNRPRKKSGFSIEKTGKRRVTGR
ncbi:MFS transporter [Brevibacillus fluminis]|uniref:MFS transporter n=1 Tax=Brevibacillus fluminis TaxID=511487 RepID=A0A3M8CNS8_9BACL|nr:MFS transporter [Brevibacillus fluminis]